MNYDSESDGDFTGPVVKEYQVLRYEKRNDTICYINDFIRKSGKNVDYEKLDIMDLKKVYVKEDQQDDFLENEEEVSNNQVAQ